MDLRCANGIKFGELVDGLIEVKCRSVRCGAIAGVVVLHQFDPLSGELVATKRFRDPTVPVLLKKDGREQHDPADSAAVRSP